MRTHYADADAPRFEETAPGVFRLVFRGELASEPQVPADIFVADAAGELRVALGYGLLIATGAATIAASYAWMAIHSHVLASGAGVVAIVLAALACAIISGAIVVQIGTPAQIRDVVRDVAGMPHEGIPFPLRGRAGRAAQSVASRMVDAAMRLRERVPL